MITAGFYWVCFERTLIYLVLSKFLCLCFHFFVRDDLVDPNINSLIFSAAQAGCVVSSVGCKNRLSDLSSCRNQGLCPRHAIYHWHCLNCIIFISESVECGRAQGPMFLKKSLRWRASPANYFDRSRWFRHGGRSIVCICGLRLRSASQVSSLRCYL